MQFRNTLLAVALGLAGLLGPVSAGATPSQASESPAVGSPAYEALLERYFQITIGRELNDAKVDEQVEGFKATMRAKPEAQKCPALSTAMDELADVDFRKLLIDYLNSETLHATIKQGLRKHLTQADLEAFLAFAESPAGRRYQEHSIAATHEAEAAIEASTEQMASSPEFKEFFGSMVTRLIPLAMKCPK